MGRSDDSLLDVVRAWIEDDPEPGTADALRQLCYAVEDAGPEEAAEAESLLRELFRAQLSFGTAGLRGEVGPGPNRMNRANVRRTAAGVAAWLRGEGIAERGVVIGRDARHRSDDFVLDLVEVLAGAGVEAHVLPAPNPTPVLAYAVRHLGTAAGIMVTASHNPGPDNGLKVYDTEGRQVDARQAATIASEMAAAGALADLPIAGASSPLIRQHGLEVEEAYLASISKVVRPSPQRAPVEVAHTSLHGVGGPVTRRACDQAGFVNLHEVSEQQDADPGFPTVAFPNPEEPGALDLLRRDAAWARADIALAHDPDADRLAMMASDPRLGTARDEESWRALSGDQLGWLLADHLILRGGLDPAGVFVTTIVSSTMLRSIAQAAGFGYTETLTGFRWIVRAPTPERPLIMGYEEALGYCVGDAVSDKDGISAMLLACEMVSDLVSEGATVWDRLDDLERRHGVHHTEQWSVRLQGGEGATRIAAAMDRLRTAPPSALGSSPVAAVNDLSRGSATLPPADVVGLSLPGARVVVRPSGTEPKLKCYLEVVQAAGDDLDAARSVASSRMDELIAALPGALGLEAV